MLATRGLFDHVKIPGFGNFRLRLDTKDERLKLKLRVKQKQFIKPLFQLSALCIFPLGMLSAAVVNCTQEITRHKLPMPTWSSMANASDNVTRTT